MRTSAKLLRLVLAALFFGGAAFSGAPPSVKQDEGLEAGRQAYEVSEYARAAQILQEAAAKNSQNAEIHLLLAKTYYEMQQHDAAIASAEKAVALDPENSVYHEWLGRTYGEKAEHAGMFSGMSLAKKTRKEFEIRRFSSFRQIPVPLCAHARAVVSPPRTPSTKMGIVETMTSGCISDQWSEVAVFAILILTLVFRPSGLLGQQLPEKV